MIDTVIGSGRQPNVEIAESAGLPISKEDGGIIVEDTLAVAPDIYAAGDIISWYVGYLFFLSIPILSHLY